MISIYTDPMKDLSSERTVVLDNGNKLYARRYDPYGLWKIHYEHGQLPEKYRGSYTGFDLALADIKRYTSDKGIGIEEIRVTYQQNVL